MTNQDTETGKLPNFVIYPILVILVPIMIIGFIRVVGADTISPMIAKHKAKDPKNIKTGGCLRYGGKNKHGSTIYSLNGQVSKHIWLLTTKKFPFDAKWGSLDGDFYRDFQANYTNKCFNVSYIHTKLLWFDVDFIYDVE